VASAWVGRLRDKGHEMGRRGCTSPLLTRPPTRAADFAPELPLEAWGVLLDGLRAVDTLRSEAAAGALAPGEGDRINRSAKHNVKQCDAPRVIRRTCSPSHLFVIALCQLALRARCTQAGLCFLLACVWQYGAHSSSPSLLSHLRLHNSCAPSWVATFQGRCAWWEHTYFSPAAAAAAASGGASGPHVGLHTPGNEQRRRKRGGRGGRAGTAIPSTTSMCHPSLASKGPRRP